MKQINARGWLVRAVLLSRRWALTCMRAVSHARMCMRARDTGHMRQVGQIDEGLESRGVWRAKAGRLARDERTVRRAGAVARPPRTAFARVAAIKNGWKLPNDRVEGVNLAEGLPLDPGGIAASLDALGVEGRIDHGQEQVDLFASSPLFASTEGQALRPVRGAGRPPGALNKTTDDWRAYWLRHYRSPLLLLGDLITADPFKLHKAIRDADVRAGVEREVSVMDVIALQRGAATDIAPYVHRKQPIAIDGGEDKALPLIVMATLDPSQMRSAIAQAAEMAGDLQLVPALLEGEVAAEKSQNVGDDAPST